MKAIATYKVRIKNRNYWETIDLGSNVYPSVEECLCFLSQCYSKFYRGLFNYYSSKCENFFDKQKLFIWSIIDDTNTYEGVFELNNQSFLEKIAKVDLNEFKKEEAQK